MTDAPRRVFSITRKGVYYYSGMFAVLDGRKKNKGFTLVELLIVIGIITALAGVILIAVDPARLRAQARNSARWMEARSILESVVEYAADNDGTPPGIDTVLRMLGTAGSGCAVSCGGTTFSDDESADFSGGTFSDTQWDSGNSWLELTALGQTNGSGNYTSTVKDAGSIISWDLISWLPERPLAKNLPGSAQSETDYSSGNANMTGNILLWHLDESSGTAAADSSGTGNGGTATGSSIVTAKLNRGRSFPGGTITDYVIKNPMVSFPTTTITTEFWVRTSDSSDGLLSYASTSSDNTWLIYNSANLAIYRGGVAVSSGVSINDNIWHHVAVTWRSSDGAVIVYKDGSAAYTGTLATGTSITGGGSLVIAQDQDSVGGSFDPAQAFAGTLDEVVIYNRVLSPTEISDHYKRGAVRLKFHVRSCDDALCAGDPFVGPDGTASTYYSELNNSSISLPSFALTNVTSSRYFQYKAFFETDSASFTPELKTVTVGYGGGTATNDACLDLSPSLVEDYIAQIPFDEKYGSAAKTYYAIQKRTSGRVEVRACGAELDEEISVMR